MAMNEQHTKASFERGSVFTTATVNSAFSIPIDLITPVFDGGTKEEFSFEVASALTSSQAICKRVMDLLFSIIALMLFSLPMFFISLAIKFSSRGPVFYSQERVGLNGRIYKMWKFRTMAVDAEGDSGPVWCTEEDPRRTRLGTFLRRTSLDELPQFWNVLKGEMAMVGPRPERPVFVKQFRWEIPGYMLRHSSPVGITGWAQVNGLRGNTSLEARVEHDLHYISQWSPWLDIKILFLTFFRGFIDKNAY